VRQQRGERIERATRLGNRSHFQPVAEDHDGNQRREFPPDLDLEKAKGCSQRCAKGNYDRQADKRHHARLAVRNLVPCPTYENEASVKENDRSENWSDEL